MPRKDRTRLSRPHLFLSTLFALTALAGWQAAPAHLAGRASANAPEDGGGAQPLAEFVRGAAVARVGDVVYNPGDKLLYVSVPSSAGAGDNSVVAVDPATGQPSGAPAFVGSEPSRLALADDNRTLYAYLDGAYAVRRFDTQTRGRSAVHPRLRLQLRPLPRPRSRRRAGQPEPRGRRARPARQQQQQRRRLRQRRGAGEDSARAL